MLIKKLAIVGVAAFGLSGLTQAADISVDGTQAKSLTRTYTATAGDFVVTDFDYTISANVALNSVEDTVAFAVGAASKKGRNAYTGSSNGGSVSACGDPTTGSAVPDAPTPSLDDAAISGCAGGS